MRRNLIRLWIVATAVFGLASARLAAGQDTPKVLMLTKSSGFQHDVVKRGANNELSLAERIVTELGEKHGFEVTATKDGTQINAENLKNYKVLFFFTQGELTDSGVDKETPMRMEDRQAILDFVEAGGGFVGTHCGGADTFHNWVVDGKKPFLEMVGGEFISHGDQQAAFVEVTDRGFPAVSHWPNDFKLNDEWYAYRGFQPDLRVLMMLHTKDMNGRDYQRPNYPITWCKKYGQGKVFYTGLGHREDVWTNPDYQKMVAGGVLWTLGKAQADASSNLEQLFGTTEAAMLRINPPRLP